METPLPSRRITRSQTSVMSSVNNMSAEENENSKQKKKGGKQDQESEKSALIDITNGSPIVGLAMESLKTPSLKTPSSRFSKKKRVVVSSNETKKIMTPGSGESLLRGQVKTLLQKVEEEEEGVISKSCFGHNLWCNKPPQVYDFSTNGNNGLNPFAQMLNEVISAPNQEEKIEKNVITRSLLLDFSEKSHDSDSSECNSLVTCQDSDASVWSVKVNASTSDEYKEYEDYEDVLCEGMSKISVNKFTGKHTRFVYNSDGELEGSKTE